jgi:hypothetical protein
MIKNPLELMAALEVLPGFASVSFLWKYLETMRMWRRWCIEQQSPLLPLNLPLISVPLFIIVVVSGALRSRWKECAMRNRKHEEKIVDRAELTDVDENTFDVAMPFGSKKLEVRNWGP